MAWISPQTLLRVRPAQRMGFSVVDEFVQATQVRLRKYQIEILQRFPKPKALAAI